MNYHYGQAPSAAPGLPFTYQPPTARPNAFQAPAPAYGSYVNNFQAQPGSIKPASQVYPTTSWSSGAPAAPRPAQPSFGGMPYSSGFSGKGRGGRFPQQRDTFQGGVGKASNAIPLGKQRVFAAPTAENAEITARAERPASPHRPMQIVGRGRALTTPAWAKQQAAAPGAPLPATRAGHDTPESTEPAASDRDLRREQHHGDHRGDDRSYRPADRREDSYRQESRTTSHRAEDAYHPAVEKPVTRDVYEPRRTEDRYTPAVDKPVALADERFSRSEYNRRDEPYRPATDKEVAAPRDYRRTDDSSYRPVENEPVSRDRSHYSAAPSRRSDRDYERSDRRGDARPYRETYERTRPRRVSRSRERNNYSPKSTHTSSRGGRRSRSHSRGRHEERKKDEPRSTTEYKGSFDWNRKY